MKRGGRNRRIEGGIVGVSPSIHDLERKKKKGRR
jgi:hypothetical protein